MSQLAHPAIATRVRSTRAVLLAALLALAAVTAIVLVIALGNDTATSDQAVAQTQSSVRADGGPDESAVAASVGSSATATPDESHIAALVAAGSTQPTGGPDESTVAASVSGN